MNERPKIQLRLFVSPSNLTRYFNLINAMPQASFDLHAALMCQKYKEYMNTEMNGAEFGILVAIAELMENPNADPRQTGEV